MCEGVGGSWRNNQGLHRVMCLQPDIHSPNRSSLHGPKHRMKVAERRAWKQHNGTTVDISATREWTAHWGPRVPLQEVGPVWDSKNSALSSNESWRWKIRLNSWHPRVRIEFNLWEIDIQYYFHTWAHGLRLEPPVGCNEAGLQPMKIFYLGPCWVTRSIVYLAVAERPCYTMDREHQIPQSLISTIPSLPLATCLHRSGHWWPLIHQLALRTTNSAWSSPLRSSLGLSFKKTMFCYMGSAKETSTCLIWKLLIRVRRTH